MQVFNQPPSTGIMQQKKYERGSTLPEFVMVLPLIMLIAITGFELLRYSFHSSTAQFLASEGLRFAVLAKIPGTNTDNSVTAVKSRIEERAAAFRIALTDGQIEVCSVPDNTSINSSISIANPCNESIGLPNDWVRVRIHYGVPMIIGGSAWGGFKMLGGQVEAMATGKRETL